MPPKKRQRKPKNSDDGRRGQPRVVIDVDEETWTLRGSNISIFDPELEYENRPGLFTVALHHHGVFAGGDYITGRVNYIDYVSALQFTLFELASMLVRVGYSRDAICESFYCHPKFNDACVGTQIGHRPDPLIEDADVPRFLKFATTKRRLIHVYVLEITRADALARQKQDQAAVFQEFLRPKSSGVKIEEIDEPPMVVPKPRKKPKLSPGKTKVNPQTPLLGWYERDVEFEDYLVDSLVKAREEWRKKDSEDENVIKNLMDEFVVVQDDSHVCNKEQQPQAVVGDDNVVEVDVVHENEEVNGVEVQADEVQTAVEEAQSHAHEAY